MKALHVTFGGVDAWVAVPRPLGVQNRAGRFTRILPALFASSVVFWSVAAVATVRLVG